MTSFAFILGVLPLVFATGSGSARPGFRWERRLSARMLLSTVLDTRSLFTVPCVISGRLLKNGDQAQAAQTEA